MPLKRRQKDKVPACDTQTAQSVQVKAPSTEDELDPMLVEVPGWQHITAYQDQLDGYDRALAQMIDHLDHIPTLLAGERVWLPLAARRVDPYAIEESRRGRVSVRSPHRASTGQTIWVGRPLTQRIFKLPKDALADLTSFDARGMHISGILSYNRVAHVPYGLIPQIRLFNADGPHQVHRIRMTARQVMNARVADAAIQQRASLMKERENEYAKLMNGVRGEPLIFRQENGLPIKGHVDGWGVQSNQLYFVIGGREIFATSRGKLYFATPPRS